MSHTTLICRHFGDADPPRGLTGFLNSTPISYSMGMPKNGVFSSMKHICPSTLGIFIKACQALTFSETQLTGL